MMKRRMLKLHLLCIFSTISTTVFGGTPGPGTPASVEVNFMKTAIDEFVAHGARWTISLVQMFIHPILHWLFHIISDAPTILQTIAAWAQIDSYLMKTYPCRLWKSVERKPSWTMSKDKVLKPDHLMITKLFTFFISWITEKLCLIKWIRIVTISFLIFIIRRAL